MSGLPERWQRTDSNSPFSQMTVHDGNQLTLIPIVNWPCRGGVLSVDLTLYHNAANTSDPPPDAPPLGPGWTHSLRTSLAEDPMLGTVTITEGDGRQHAFTRNEDYSYTHPPGVFETLVKNGDGTFRLTRHNQDQWNFSAAGKLTSIVDLNNNSISLSYDGAGKLTSLADPSGRVLSFGYDGDGFLTSVTDPLNRVFTFSFTGTPKSLWKVTEPSPSTLFIEFGYDSVKRVTSVKDKRGNSWSMAYDGTGRVTTVTNPASGSRSYNYTDGTKVTDENGNYVTYQYGTSGQVTSFSEFPVLGGETTTLFVYDAQLNVTSNTRPRRSGLGLHVGQQRQPADSRRPDHAARPEHHPRDVHVQQFQPPDVGQGCRAARVHLCLQCAAEPDASHRPRQQYQHLWVQFDGQPNIADGQRQDDELGLRCERQSDQPHRPAQQSNALHVQRAGLEDLPHRRAQPDDGLRLRRDGAVDDRDVSRFEHGHIRLRCQRQPDQPDRWHRHHDLGLRQSQPGNERNQGD
jgi:YD repeat-containing protein